MFPIDNFAKKLEAKMLRKLKGETKIWRKSRDAKERKISQEFISQLSALKLNKIVKLSPIENILGPPVPTLMVRQTLS